MKGCLREKHAAGREAERGSMEGEEDPQTLTTDEWSHGINLIVPQKRRRPMNDDDTRTVKCTIWDGFFFRFSSGWDLVAAL